MKFFTTLCLVSVAVALVISGTEARSRHRHHSRRQQEEEPRSSPVQQEEPKPVEIEPVQSEEAVAVSEEKIRPARARKTPVVCNTAAANIAKPDQVETSNEKTSFEVIEPDSPESLEIEPIAPEPIKSKKLVKPKGKVVPADSDESMSVEDTNGEDEDGDSGNFSAALESLEEPTAFKALTSGEIPEEASSRAVESEEEKPKARRSKHNRKDIRRIGNGRPYRKKVVFHSSDEE